MMINASALRFVDAKSDKFRVVETPDCDLAVRHAAPALPATSAAEHLK